MTLGRYSGTLSPSNASMISSHLAGLSAFHIYKPMIAHMRFVYRLPLTAFLATDTILLIASMVNRLFLKPNWLSHEPPTCCIAASSLTYIIRQTIFWQYPVCRVVDAAMVHPVVYFPMEGVLRIFHFVREYSSTQVSIESIFEYIRDILMPILLAGIFPSDSVTAVGSAAPM